MKLWSDEPVREWGTFEKFCLVLFAAVLIVIAVIVIVPSQGLPAIPKEPQQCHVTGYVYGTPDLDQVEIKLDVPMGCPIAVSRFERRLVLYSSRWMVEVPLPQNGGWLPFAYTWGADRAYIGLQEIPVVAGPREGLG